MLQKLELIEKNKKRGVNDPREARGTLGKGCKGVGTHHQQTVTADSHYATTRNIPLVTPFDKQDVKQQNAYLALFLPCASYQIMYLDVSLNGKV